MGVPWLDGRISIYLWVRKNMETRFSLGFHLASRSGEGSIEPQGFHAQRKPDVFCGELDEWNSVM